MNDNKHYFDKDGHLVTDAIIAYIRDDLKNDQISKHIQACNVCLDKYTQLFASNQEIEEEGLDKLFEQNALDALGITIDEDFKSYLQEIAGDQFKENLQEMSEEQLQAYFEDQLQKDLQKKVEQQLQKEAEEDAQKEADKQLRYDLYNIKKDLEEMKEQQVQMVAEQQSQKVVAHSMAPMMSSERTPLSEPPRIGIIPALMKNQYFKVAAPFTIMSVMALMMVFNEPDKEFKRIGFDISFAVDFHVRSADEMNTDKPKADLMWNKIEKNKINKYGDYVPTIDYKRDDLIVRFKKIDIEANRFTITANDQIIETQLAGKVIFSNFLLEELGTIKISVQEYKDDKPISKIDVKYLLE